ncbi:putative reverse transcriptase domain-containing protein [Tanacetum coccineum]
MRQRRLTELLSDYDYEIRYHPGKANVVADALSRKERIRPLRIRALMMTVHNDIPKLKQPSEMLQQLEIPVWKWERITMDFVSGLPRTPSSYDTIWKSLGTKLDMNTAYHPQTDGQREITIQKLEDILCAYPLKGVMHFGKRGKLSLCYIKAFKIVGRVGPVAYMLELPEKIKGIHSSFHVSNLKKCLAEGDIVVPLEEIQLDDKLHMIEEPVEIVD